MKDALLGMTSKNLEGSPVSWGDMLTYLGLWLLMSSVATGGNTRSYWDTSDTSTFKCAPFRFLLVIPNNTYFIHLTGKNYIK